MSYDMAPFGPVVFRYTDAQAVEDGVLVDVSAMNLRFQGKPLNRVTRAVWDELLPFARVLVPDDDTEAMREMLATKLGTAGLRDDIVQVPPGYWLMENEVQGWTLMKPEDY